MWISCIVLTGSQTQAESLALSLGGQVATLRLIAAPGQSNGRYLAGIEIVMTPGSHTYWKQPGEAGVPPVFAFNGSTNVTSATVRFPTPSRISEGGIEAFGYTDRVVFPVEVVAADPSKPSELKMVADYAVCNKICIPAHAAAALVLSPGGEGVDGAKVTAAVADLPLALPAVDRSKLVISPSKGAAKPSWTIAWSGSTPVDDIFVDAPEGFYFDTRKTATNRFALTAVQIVSATKTTQIPISLTLARKTESLVANETLDVAATAN